MQQSSKKIKAYLYLLYILLIIFVAGYLFFYVTYTSETYAKTYAYENQERYTENISDLINQEKASLDPTNRDGIVVNNTITYLENVYQLNDLLLLKYELAIFDDYIFVIDNSNFKAISISDLLTTATLNKKADNYLIMNNEGLIYYYDGSETVTNLNSFIDHETSNYFETYFSKNLEGVIKTKRLNNDVYLSFKTLDDYNDLYFIQLFQANNIYVSHLNNNLGLIIGIALFFIIIIVVQIFIFKSIHIKNAEIEGHKIKFYYTKPYIITIDKLGKIKKLNNKILKEIDNIKTYLNVDDLKITNFEYQNNVLSLVMREEPITVEFTNKIIRFITTKTKNGYYLIGEDITNTETNVEEMRSLAYFDQLSKQPNYYYLKYVLEAHLSSEEFKMEKIAAVILDIIDFTVIKNIFGRENGYKLLEKSAKVIDQVAHKYNGQIFNTEEDKFVIFFKNIKTHEQINDFMNDVFIEVAKPLSVSGNIINVQMNGGIYFYNINEEQELTLKFLYDSLLAALAKSKETSSPSYTVFDETIRLHVFEEKTMLNDLMNAIEKDEIVIYLQPQYNNKLKRIVGFEALARWNNPKYINRSPQKFIMLAEKNNMIVSIGEIIMRKTFEMAQLLRDYNVTISFNVSPVEVLQDGFVEKFLEEYRKYKLPKGSIALEITETFLITSLKDINDKLKALKKEGIDIHLDDFGIEYSSLLYLRELAVDAIKIDRLFIRYLETDKKDREIVKMLINLITALDYEIIAEGVETDYQNTFLYRQGLDIIQGFILSPAVNYEEALKLLEDYNIKKTKTLKVPERKRGIKL